MQPGSRQSVKMLNRTYLGWVFKNTRTERRQDSADAAELALGPWRGAIGVGASPDRESLLIWLPR